MNGYEADWVALAKAGDRSAMRELYERTRSRIFSLAYRYAGNAADAEDILQDSFIKAFSSLRKCQLNENSYFATWLYRIAVNCSLDHIRRRRTRESHANAEWSTRLSADTENEGSATPEGEYLRGEIRQQVQRGLAKLSSRKRMVVVLRHYQQLKIGEIAAVMGCSQGSVKRQLFRALAQLKKELPVGLGE
ncbi:MAG: sigma-70 family RNA polymerase sigma factor [Candidatus Aminicenantes bacterium]|nr:sigma-70 family RNA polymerase sigma factor [Candidatus Aminicenantes bacterium]